MNTKNVGRVELRHDGVDLMRLAQDTGVCEHRNDLRGCIKTIENLSEFLH
jgi:hypothetical protein